MDHRESQIPFLGTFHRLFSYIVSTLTSLVFKPTSVFVYWLQGLAILHRFFNFVVRSFEAQASKLVTLGHSVYHGVAQVPNPDDPADDRNVHSLADGTSLERVASRAVDGPGGSENLTNHDLENENKELSAIHDNGVGTNTPMLHGQGRNDSYDGIKQVESPEEAVSAADPEKVPKKTVSFSEMPEVVDTGNKKKRKKKKKATERMNSSKSIQRENDEKLKESVEPLRPILKTGSNLSEKTEMFDVQRQADMG